MTMRHDALAAAAEFVLAAERLARETEGLVATVGELQIPHGACNVVPGRVELTLDVRHADDVVRADAVATCRAWAGRGIDVSWAPIHHHEATPCSPDAAGEARRSGGRDGTVHRAPERRRA